MDSFTPKVIPQLGFYLYMLIDQQNGKPYYVGKGQPDFAGLGQ